VEVAIEIDPHSQRVRATATGASEMRTRTRAAVGEEEARIIAARSMEVALEATHVAAATDRLRVIQAVLADQRRPMRVIDLEGSIRRQRSDAVVVRTSAREGVGMVRHMRAETTAGRRDGGAASELLLIAGAHIAELAATLPTDQAAALAQTELEGLAPDASVILVATIDLPR
jgi:hypothetical protein